MLRVAIIFCIAIFLVAACSQPQSAPSTESATPAIAEAPAIADKDDSPTMTESTNVEQPDEDESPAATAPITTVQPDDENRASDQAAERATDLELLTFAKTLQERKDEFFAIAYLFLGIEGGVLTEEGITQLNKIMSDVEQMTVPEDDRFHELHTVALEYMGEAIRAHELKQHWLDSGSITSLTTKSMYTRAAFEAIQLSHQFDQSLDEIGQYFAEKYEDLLLESK
ncbi:MAG: hypothetical protein KDE46_00075 [Caldilineaceae bacterium]|nr:hypothetical protein [Caldilineaceae bacterium]